MQDLLLFIWSMLCLLAVVRLLQGTPSARNTAGAVASIGLIGSLPLVTAGIPLFGLAIGVACAVVLYLLWNSGWSNSLLPGMLQALLALAIGLLFAYFHAFQVRNGILPPPGVTDTTPILVRRVLEADQAAALLTTFYIFVFTILAITGISLALFKIGKERKWGSYVGFGAAALLFIGAIFLVGSTNLQVIQADIVYKRADPWDKQASRSGNLDQASGDPFGADRLMMIALVSAVLAHYVEIHFGIAIAATRTYFFVYIACLFMIGYFLPRLSADRAQQAERPQGRKRGRARDSSFKDKGWLGPVLSSSMILALIIGVLGYNYITYSLPPGQAIETISDVPSTGDIFQQSFFVNAAQGFLESPFLFMLLMLSWILGALLYFSELVKQERIKKLVEIGRAHV